MLRFSSITISTGRRLPSTALLVLAVILSGQVCRAHADSPRREVLIYYANETAVEAEEAASWETILGWLDSSEHPKARKIAGQLRRDRADFPKAVDRQIADLGTILAGPPETPTVVIFTNRSVRRGKYRIVRPGASVVEEAAVTPLPSDDLILTANPLARADIFELCLREVARRFDPAKHRFVLNTQSHGNVRMAMMPRLIVRADQTDREELLSVATGANHTPSWDRPIGVTKDEYFTILRNLGETGRMQFSLVFMESCSGVMDQMQVRVPPNVHRLYMTGNEKTAYQNIDYAALLADCDGRVPLSQRMDEALAGRFPSLVRGGGGWSRWWLVLLCWIPLVLWLGWVLVRRARSPKHPPVLE